MHFLLFLMIVAVVGCIMFLLGQYCGWSLGFDDGFASGLECAEAHADDPSIDDIRWQLCAPSVASVASDKSDSADTIAKLRALDSLDLELARDFH